MSRGLPGLCACRLLACWFAVLVLLLEAQPAAGQQLRSVTLRDVLSEALASYPRVQAATARIRAAQGARATAGRFENPMLEYGVENAALPRSAAPLMDREAMTMATFSLQSLYQRWPRLQVANAELAATRAEAGLAAQETGVVAAHAFYRVAQAQLNLDVARDLSAWMDSIVAYNRVRVQEGAAAEADLIRSQVERDMTTAQETMAATELLAAQANLRTYLTNLAEVRVVFDSIPLPLPDDVPDTIALRRRFDVIGASQRREAAHAGIGVERSLLMETVQVTIGVKQSAGSTSLVGGASLPVPLFNQNRGEVARAQAERDVAAFEYALVERAARTDLQSAKESARLLTQRVSQLSLGFLARADEARRISLGAYREGAIPLLQVIDAARTWGEARRVYHQTVFTQHEAVIALLVAQGSPVSDLYRGSNR